MWASVIFSGVWCGTAVAIISLDVGRLSVNEQQTSGTGFLLLAAVFGLMVTVTVVNIQRVKQGRPPLLFRQLTKE